MRIKTLVAISLAAVLAASVNSNLRQSHPPVSQYQTSANAPQKEKLEQIMPETVIEVKPREIKGASRNSQRQISPDILLNQSYARSFMAENYGWQEDQFQCLVQLWERESGWKETAHNKSSGAHGIPQSLPGSKMAAYGDDWKTNPHTQIKWGLSYIKGRYETPCGAWSAFKNKGWY
jgi:hypothetical protein